MPKRRVIRRLEIAGRRTFDEQLWPINALIVVLCGVVAGMIIGTSDFSTPVVWRNGWVRLATLVGSVALLLWLAHLVRGVVGRRLQLGAVFSLLIHVIIGIALHSQYLENWEARQDAARRDTRPVITEFEYHIRAIDDRAPPEAHERPVETEAPEDRPLETARTVPEQQPTETELQPTPVPDAEPTVEPSRLQMRRNEFAAARRSEQESLLSRSTADAPTEAAERVDSPEAAVARAEVEQRVDARNTSIERQQTTPMAAQPTNEAPATVAVTQDAARPSRREATETEPAPSAAAAQLTRAVAQPLEVPRAAVAAPAAPVRVDSSQPPELQVNTPLARRETTSPLQRREITEPTQTTSQSPDVAQASPARQTAEAQPVVTQVAESSPARSATAAPTAEQPVAAPALAQTAQSSEPPALPGPASTSVARSAAAAPSATGATSVEASAAPSAPSVAQVGSAAREQGANPSVSVAAQTAVAPARAATAAAEAASPVPIGAPVASVAANASQQTPNQQPAATALARGMSGTIGSGQAPSFDAGAPAAPSNATVASAASQRAASSLSASNPSVAASSPSPLRASRSQANIDSATAQAENVPAAEDHGGRIQGQIDATASAAVDRRASTAPSGRIAAAEGNMTADTGAPQLVSRAGGGRGDAGGQPTVASIPLGDQPGRTTTSPGAPIAAIAADQVALAPSAPASTSGGAPGAAELAAQSTPPSRASSGSTPTPSNQANAAEVGNAPTQIAGATGSMARSTEARAPQAATGAEAPAPQRATVGSFAADTQADDVGVASAPRPEGTEQGTPLDTAVTADVRQPAGLPGRTTTNLVGALVGETAVDAPAANEPGTIASLRAASREGVDGPSMNGSDAGAPLARNNRAVVPAGATEAIDVPDLGTDAPSAQQATAGDPSGLETAPSALARRSAGGVPVQIASVVGPGGLGVELSPVVGSRNPRARRESDLVHDADMRFLGREISGATPVEGFVREATKGFDQRGRERGTGQGRVSTKTEEAIERGLDFLARSQQPDGSWSFQKFPGVTQDDIGGVHADTAATGLALMAFLGGGYDHFEDKHREVVRRGLRFLIEQQKENGDLYFFQEKKSHESAWLYSHAIASIALCEALGMTGDEELREPAQKAIYFIEESQNRQYGGWRYEPGKHADTSVSGWQLMALKSGELAGLKVKKETYDAVGKWLDRAALDGGAQYVYDPTRPSTQDPADRRRPTMTSVGLLMRLYLGWDRTRPAMQRGAQHILTQPPSYGFAANKQRDTYYWYYATQVMFHMRGDYWRRWNSQLYPLLIGTQTKGGDMAGSWDPGGTVPDRWGGQGGRIYVTAMNLLSLEVYYRHLPIYESTAK